MVGEEDGRDGGKVAWTVTSTESLCAFLPDSVRSLRTPTSPQKKLNCQHSWDCGLPRLQAWDPSIPCTGQAFIWRDFLIKWDRRKQQKGTTENNMGLIAALPCSTDSQIWWEGVHCSMCAGVRIVSRIISLENSRSLVRNKQTKNTLLCTHQLSPPQGKIWLA